MIRRRHICGVGSVPHGPRTCAAGVVCDAIFSFQNDVEMNLLASNGSAAAVPFPLLPPPLPLAPNCCSTDASELQMSNGEAFFTPGDTGGEPGLVRRISWKYSRLPTCACNAGATCEVVSQGSLDSGIDGLEPFARKGKPLSMGAGFQNCRNDSLLAP